LKVSDIMRTPVVSVAPDTRVIDAVRLLLETNRRGLPVIDKAGELVGIISEGDFHHRAELGTDRPDRPWFNAFFGPGESASKFAHTHGLRVEEVMTKTVICVDADTDLSEAATLMDSHHVAQLPVICGTAVVGMITKTELLAAVEADIRQSEPGAPQNPPSRDDILAAIRKQSWATGALVDVIVTDRVVEMWGVIVDPNQRNALKALIENIPGIVKVIDHLKLRSNLLL
jgi:CBS domain-containing protein